MTIFDTLRYPVSDLPTEEELTSLPENLFLSWCILNYGRHHSVEWMVNYLEWIGQRDRIRDLWSLRKMIREYDDDL